MTDSLGNNSGWTFSFLSFFFFSPVKKRRGYREIPLNYKIRRGRGGLIWAGKFER
jgi:hypothetical protein